MIPPPPSVPPPEQPDEDSSSFSEQEWAAFQRDAAEGGGAAPPKEPSARARVVARRLREQDAAVERSGGGRRRWRRGGKAARPAPATPPGWRTGPAWQEMNGRRGRRRGLWSAVGVVAAVALVAVAVRPSLLTDRLPGHDAAADSAPSALPAETALPTGAPGAVDQAGTPTRAHPFLGSPARSWAGGADAIVLPTAKAAGGLSKDEVALALRRTKEFLVASNLDPKVLRGGSADGALALLDPQQPDLLPEIRRALRSPARTHDPLNYVTRFDPQQVVLAGDTVKVRGHLTFDAGKAGQVRVHADYSFVYPLVHTEADGDSRVARTIVRRELTMTLNDPAKWIATKGKLSLTENDAHFYNFECGVYDGYIHPVFPGDTPTGAPATGPETDPYDRSATLEGEADAREECGTVTRT
ncbi:hypothetical protein PV620_16625 [Streptomyces sp. ME02-6978a]|uniref:hypothetical protein n=1 Tax=unclassified Streptomyces TaxID=2593676 RepID=UPI0029A1C94C|nr:MULTISPECIES: hypothetical protein [unclassified Streptomyces]MDX3089715.1 hypothetical protein [Streptomyces sp. ME12-02E]MDX3333181.1 hypothetical protein [Streptomyces sp. ME02-6978a]